ncbi:hypothetical protein ABT117_05335 [Streptomyces sp. NPDC002262]|uniref:hypothetical protein n=1 Tax=Streptomyces sp. NPDC002262 TaxID=3154414 RepID=UPI003326F3FE
MLGVNAMWAVGLNLGTQDMRVPFTLKYPIPVTSRIFRIHSFADGSPILIGYTLGSRSPEKRIFIFCGKRRVVGLVTGDVQRGGPSVIDRPRHSQNLRQKAKPDPVKPQLDDLTLPFTYAPELIAAPIGWETASGSHRHGDVALVEHVVFYVIEVGVDDVR